MLCKLYTQIIYCVIFRCVVFIVTMLLSVEQLLQNGSQATVQRKNVL